MTIKEPTQAKLKAISLKPLTKEELQATWIAIEYMAEANYDRLCRYDCQLQQTTDKARQKTLKGLIKHAQQTEELLQHAYCKIGKLLK